MKKQIKVFTSPFVKHHSSEWSLKDYLKIFYSKPSVLAWVAGFTLIELIIALSIFSVIALSLYGAFASGMKIERLSEKGGRLYREIRWAFDIIERDLENMVPFDFKNSYPEKLAFTGSPDSFSFIVPKDSGLVLVSYSIKAPEAGSIHATIIGKHYNENESFITDFKKEEARVNLLVREEMPFIESLENVSGKQPETDVLSARIEEASFKVYYAYLEGDQDNAEIVWKDRWDLNYLPSGVRIELTFVPVKNSQELKTIKKDFFIPSGYLGREELIQ